jgi:Flp pilus assembly pilin Flp
MSSGRGLGDSGGTSIEYTLMAALIAVAFFVGADLLGNAVQGFFESTSDIVEDATPE